MAKYQRKRRLLAPDVLDRAAAFILEAARDEQVPVVLAGGYAMQFFGSPRLTGDVDIVAADELAALPPGEPLSFGGYESVAEGVPVDVIIRDDDYAELYDEALEHPVSVEGMPMVAPEYLAAMKMVAGRRKDDEDLEFLLTTEGLLDLDVTREIIRQHLGVYAVGEFDAFLAEAQWRRNRAKR